MRIAADRIKCSGIGICESLAPDVFEVDDNGHLNLNREEVSADEQELIERVVDSCPTAALRLIR